MPGEDSDPFESKASDWGRIKGRLVSLDYSTPAHDTAEAKAELRRAGAANETTPQAELGHPFRQKAT
jgi:hypothetical protein